MTGKGAHDDLATDALLTFSAFAAGVSPFIPAGIVALGRYAPSPQRAWETYVFGAATWVLSFGFLLAFAGLVGVLFAPQSRAISTPVRVSLALGALLGLVLNAGLGLLTLWLWAMSTGSRC